MILDAVQRQALPDGTSLDERLLEKFSEAALELINCTVNVRLVTYGSTVRDAFVGASEIDDLVKRITAIAQKESLSGGEERLISAFLCFKDAIQDKENQSHDEAAKLKAFIAPMRAASKILVSETSEKPMIGEFTHLMTRYLPIYRDYGLVPAASLATAIAQHLRDQRLVDCDKLVNVRVYDNISLKVCPPNLIAEAFMAGMKRPEMEGIEEWSERTLEVFSSADAIVNSVHASKHLSRVMNAGMAACLLYDAVRTSLGWILNRYEHHGVEAPADLFRERQVAEEARAWIWEMLELAGERLLSTPITHLVSRLVMTEQVPRMDAFRDLVVSGTYLIPGYPDVLCEAWNEV